MQRRAGIYNSARHLTMALLALVLAGCATAAIEAQFVPRAEPWQRWAAHDETSTESIDHGAWDRLLAAYLASDRRGVNRFAYGRVTAADRSKLDAYVAALSALPVDSYNRAEQFAYWVNLYNAVTVRVVLGDYPVQSIRDINDGFLSPGPWDRKLVAVEGEALSLNDIEHRILRPLWRDARIHYALNCAAVGCPNLRSRAFTAANSAASLEAAARDYINDRRGVRFVKGGLVLSSIFIWYRDDFGGDDAGVLAHIKRYAAPDLAAEIDGGTKVQGYEYDWSLNEAGTS